MSQTQPDKTHLPSSKTLAKATAVFGGASAFSVLAALVRSKVAAVTIGPAGVGLNALYVTISNLVATLMSCGLLSSSVPTLCQAEGEEQRQRVRYLRLLGCLLAVLSIPVTCIVALFYSPQVFWLSIPVVALVLSGIETAVMKSLQATRMLTASLIATAVISVVCTIPFFIWLGIDGVIWAVVCTVTLSSLVTCVLGYRVCDAMPSFRLWGRGLWDNARPMLVLGVAFLVSGVMAQGVDLINQMWIESVATLAMVGLYKAGYQLSVTYTSMIFTAIANDFFPRLSSIAQDLDARNRLITQQIRVLMYIVVPLILLFVILVPWVVPLLFSQEFLPIIPMVRVAALAIIAKAIYLPLCYLPIALKCSKHYLFLEVTSWTSLCLCILGGYHLFGLLGAGCGILVANVFDLIVAWIFCRCKYSFRLTR